MNELIPAVLVAVGGAAFGFLVGVAIQYRRIDAAQHARRMAVWELRAETRRHDTTLRALAQAQQREAQAAAHIVSLSYALHDATAQVAQGNEAAAAIGADPQAMLRRFSLN